MHQDLNILILTFKICTCFGGWIRAYISAARRLSPYVPKDLEEYIASAYSSIRQEEAKSNTPHSYTTVRTLLSILRISAVSLILHLFIWTTYIIFHMCPHRQMASRDKDIVPPHIFNISIMLKRFFPSWTLLSCLVGLVAKKVLTTQVRYP